MADNAIPSWEESTPIENNNTIPSWEESTPVENRIFSPTKNNWNLLRKSFAGDPLAFIDDPQVRTDLEFATGKFENPDLERKKWALAAYFAQTRKEEIQFCHANIDTLLEQFNGRKVTIDEAWQDRQEAFGLKKRDKGFWESRPVAAVVAGEGQVAESTFNASGFLAKLWAMGIAAEIQGELLKVNPQAAKLVRDPFEAGETAENAVRGVYKKHYAPITAWSQENMALPDDWMTNSNSFGNWCANAAIATINYLPQLAAQTGLTVATGGTSALATVYGINGYYKIKDDHPEMSESEAAIYGVGIGMINGGLEKITLGIIKGNVSKEFAKQGIKKGILEAAKHFGSASGKEGMQEAAEQFAENLLDIKMGLRGDTKNWKASQYWREMTRGVPESAFLGAVTGAPLATDAYVAKRQIAARQDTMRSMVHDKVQELSAKEDLSPEEAAELEKLKVVDDAGNSADVEKAAQEIYEKEIIRLREEAERDAELTDEERLEQEGREGEENYRLRNEKLQHNPQETIDTANELIKQFPDIDLDVVYSPEDLPADVQARIAEDDLDVSRIRAWVDDSDTVHLIASNVRPSEVARTLGHEIIGHKGLRTVFGENFDSLLDQVYKDHFEEVSLLAQRYHRDTETLENQRYLTEEFLADCADAKTKPSWWKEFLGFVRQQLRKILPNMRFSDADIESALSRSARAMRKRSKKAANEFTEADIADIRFMLDENLPEVSEEKIADYQSRFGNVINTDSAKLLFRNDGYDPHDIESVKKFHPRAGAIARRLFDKFLQERKGKGNGNVVFTGGGTGSGKSSIMGDPAVKNADFVFDSTMVNYEAARQSIQKVIDNGQTPLLAFVYRDPADAWFNGVQKRNKNADGHIVPETVFANTHVLARETFLHLVDEFGKKVEYIIKEIESGKDAAEISIEELENKPKYTKEQIKEALYAGSYTEAKGFLEQIRSAGDTDATTDTGLAEAFQAKKTDDTGLHAAGRLDDGRRDRRIRESSSGDIGVNEDSGIRFAVAPEDENLVVMHNVTAAKLRKAAKLGGLPVPSLAIVDAEKSDFDNFGEISLIADKSLIDPKIKSNKVYNADIYSPRAPEIIYEYTQSDFDRAYEKIKPFETLDPEDRNSLDKTLYYYKNGMTDRDFADALKSLPATQKWYSNTNNEDLDFDTWWESVALPELNFSQNGKIFNGYTPSGKRKWLPANLENIVKLMTKKVRNGEGFNYGIGNIRSMKARQFKSIADIKKSRDNIVSEEAFKQIKKDIQEEYQQLEEDMRRASSDNGYSWGWDTGSDSLLAMAEGGRDNIQYLEDRFGDDPEILDKMAAFLDKLVNMPAEYFEAKPQRAVGFDEFKAAVVPEDLPADVRKILEDAGLEIYTYGKTPRKAALQMAAMDNELRFSLAEYSEDDQRDIIKILKPFTGQYAELKEEEYAAYLEKHGVKIPVKDAWYFALEACRENQKDARARGIKRRNDWLYDNFPLYREIVDFTGSTDFVIKPAHRFHGEAFTGAWISPEFRKYSEKRSRGKKESEASYRKYLSKRENALANADGMSSDELAEAIARKWGRDSLDVEQEIIDFFRDLSKKEFYHNYTAWREENVFADKEAQKAAMEEWMKQEQAKIEDEVIEILQKGQPVTEEWVWNNRKVYQELYRQMFDGKEAPYSPGKKDLEAINAALMQEGANASTYAQAYKVAREAAWVEYQAKYHALQEKVLQSKADAVSLQREALKFAEENLPAEYRSEFVRSVVSLLDYSTSPSNKYPEERRMHEFRNIQSRIIRRAAEVRKDNGILAIREMLDSAKIKRNYKGIPTSVLPSEQRRVDRIRQAINMNLATVTNAIEYNNQKIMELEGDEEVEDLMDNFLEDNRLLEMFGNLENRSADDVDAAAKVLENIIKGGKAEFKDAITKRKAEVDAMRKRAVDDATFGKNEYKDRGDAQKHSNYWLKNESLGTLLRIVSGKSIQDFDNSVAGELYRKVEDSTQKEQTSLRHMQEDLDAALRDIAGVTGNRLQVLRKKGKFFRMVSEVVEHTGVFKTEYSRPIKTGKVDFVFEHGRRGLLKRAIPVEDYEWYGKMRPGARSILQKIDNGEKVALWQDVILDDAAIAFLKQQLADFDAGLKQSYEVFNNESDDANFNRMIEEERQGGKLIVFSHDPNETSSTVEVPLSQGAALQILLTWEQEHYQPNMKWNGWTEKSIEQLRKFIKPEVLQMGYWMRDQIAKNKAALDAKVFERYGAHLPLNENYFPAAFRGGKTKSVQVDSELGRGAGSMSINPNFLIARKFHLKPVDTDADAFTSFLSNQLDQGHFLAWSDAVRDLKAVYGGTMVQKSIADNFGKAVVSNLVERVATISRGGGEFSNDYAARLLAKLYRHWVPAKIAINGSSFIKQLLGTVAYMNHVPVKDFVYYFGKTLNFSNPDYREFVKWAKNTDYMKNRMGGGLDKDLSYLLNYTRDSKAYSPLADALLDAGTFFTRFADSLSAMHGGYAAYMYALDQARKSGYSEGEAREAARRAWMRATDETQQSGYLKDQNYFQSNQGAFRYLTAFMTTPIQTMNLQLQTINEIRYGSDKKAAWKKLGRQILVNHLIVPTLMQFTTDMLRYGFDIADWWDEAEFEDYFLAWMLGSFESVFLTGKLVKSIGDYALDRIVGRKMSFADSISALPLADDLKRDAGLLVKIADGEKELTETELMDAVKALGDVGMAIGAFKPEYGVVGAIIHAVGAQGKRIVRWFENKK